MLGNLKAFFLESRREFKHINWPTRKETIRLVLIVISISVVVAIFLGTLDFLFLALLRRII